MTWSLARRLITACLVAVLVPPAAVAHGLGEHVTSIEVAWTAAVVIALGVSALLYGRGVYRLWHSSQVGAGLRVWESLSFMAGWLSLGIALLSPIDQWGERSFAAHMVQHEIIMLVAAPLLVLGRPVPAFLWALSLRRRRQVGARFRRPLWRRFWTFVVHPLTAWTTYAVTLWIWHVPAFFSAAVVNDAVHLVQHLSFLLASLLFWWVALGERSGDKDAGIGVLSNFTTAIHSSILGAFLTFSSQAWYAPYLERSPLWGLSPLEDQQLGGLIMWIPGGLVHMAAGLALLARYMRVAQSRAMHREQSAAQLTLTLGGDT